MNDLILRNHLDFLRKNLQQISQALESERSQRDYVKRLASLLENRSILEFRKSTLHKVAELDDFIEDCMIIRGDCPNCSQLESVEENIQTIREKIKIFTKEVSEAVDLIKKMQDRNQEIEQRLKWIIQTEVEGEVYQLIAKIETIDEEIHSYKSNTANIEKLNHYWQDLKSIDEDSRKIFDEYVDFLRGVAMRDEGFDLGICELADKLVHEISSQPIWKYRTSGYKSLAIPSRQEKMSESLAHLTRLGFPEWTIWTLPLAACELFYSVIDDEFVKELIKQPGVWQSNYKRSPKRKKQLRHLIVDAFATYTLGPAYAYTLCFLRFNPLKAYNEKDTIPSDATRFLVIHQMLQRMKEDAAKKSQVVVYQDIIESLNDQWNAALKQTQFNVPENLISIEGAKKIVDSLWEIFKPKFFTLYDAEDWNEIKDNWVNCLSEDSQDSVQELDIRKGRLVFALNAAWLARMKAPEKCDKIASAAKDLMERIIEFDLNKGGGPSAP